MQIHDGSRDYKAIKEQPMQMRARYIPPRYRFSRASLLFLFSLLSFSNSWPGFPLQLLLGNDGRGVGGATFVQDIHEDRWRAETKVFKLRHRTGNR